MKSQLLEDIDDSQSAPVAPVPCRVQPVKPAAPIEPRPRPRPEVWSRRAAPADMDAPRGRRSGVWRVRDASAPPEPVIERVPAPEAPPQAPPPLPDIAAFASRAPDWAIPLTDKRLPWTERWGRKALGWSSAVVLALVLGGVGTWMLRETQVESTLAVVAGNAPATLAAAPAPAVVAEPEALPPLRLLPPESVAATPAVAPGEPLADTINPIAAAPAAAPAAAVRVPEPAEPQAVAPAPEALQRPAAKRIPERRLAVAAPAKRSKATQEKKQSARQRERIVAKASPASRAVARPPARTAPRPEPPQPAASPLAETLRMCRAAGYHATACIKRGCEATRFGLACRG